MGNDAIGIKPIKEMTREELIYEIIEVNRIGLEGQSMGQLKAGVAQLRLSDYKERLLKEAGIKEGPIGMLVIDEEEDND